MSDTTYFDIVRSITSDPEVLRAVSAAEQKIINDRSKDVSYALTKVRTINSSAKTALLWLKREQRWRDRGKESDPDLDDIVIALEKTVELTDRWKRK